MKREDLPSLTDEQREALDDGYVVIEGTQGDDHDRQSFGPYTIDNTTGVVRIGDASIELTAFETIVLNRLITARGELVSKAELNIALYPGGTEPASNSVEVIVCRLRQKFGAEAIRTKRGVGYALTGGAQS